MPHGAKHGSHSKSGRQDNWESNKAVKSSKQEQKKRWAHAYLLFIIIEAPKVGQLHPLYPRRGVAQGEGYPGHIQHLQISCAQQAFGSQMSTSCLAHA